MEVKTLPIYRMLPAFRAEQDLHHRHPFNKQITIGAVSGTISSSSRLLHVQFVLSKVPNQDPYFPDKCFAVFNTGMSGKGEFMLSNLKIKAKELYFYYWAHNMFPWRRDFHGSYTIYYEQ